MIGRWKLVVLSLLGLCASLFSSCAPPGSGLQSDAQIAAPAPGTARVWFVRTSDPQEQFLDPIIFANGQQLGGSWLVGTAGGDLFCEALPSDVGPAYVRRLTDKGPPRAI